MTEDGLSPVKRALLEIRELRARLTALESGIVEPIAIIGMGLRMPGGADDAAALADLLWSGIDAVSPVPPERWSTRHLHDPDPDAPGRMITRHGGFLSGVDLFDDAFFGISPREAASMDPQQRILLETSWHALEDAGYAYARLDGSRTGVYIGVSNSDYGRAVFNRPDLLDGYAASGSAFSVVAGRISYTLGLRGPSMAVDTACSSSLVALHLACQALRAKECDMALAGGINLILRPELNICFSKARMMAADGRCKTFDADADGYVRGEGAGILLLKRLSDAVASGDRIVAVAHGSAVNQDGSSNGLTAPNGPAQEAVIRDALAQGGIDPSEISYVETHGTGTRLGDPIEVGALGAVFAAGREQTVPLLIGSVKTNFGHLEAAAGIAGVIKVILCLQRRSIPPHLHFRTGNPEIDWDALPIAVPKVATPWHPPGPARRLAGVSSFGFSGTNAHIVLGEAPAPAARMAPRSPHMPFLLPLSARDPASLTELANRYAGRLQDVAPAGGATLGDICFTAGAGRKHFRHRLAVRGGAAEELRAGLAAFAEGYDHPAVAVGQADLGTAPRIAFVFAGQGADYPRMAADLDEAAPAFREALDICAAILAPHGDLHALLRETAPFAPPAMFAVDYAMAMVWQSWGVLPDIVLGHGVGECVAACFAGLMSLADALALVMPGMGARPPGLGLQPPRITLLSGLTGLPVTEADFARPDRWLGRLRRPEPGRPDHIEQSRRALADRGTTHAIEIGPHSPHPLETLQRLYVDGADIDWARVTAGRGPRRVSLPAYPFRRARHWIEPAPPAADPWIRVERVLDRQADKGPVDLNVAAYPAIWASLERLALGHIAAVLRGGGVFATANEARMVDQVLAACGIVANHRRLVGSWLNRLAAQGWLIRDERGFVAADKLPPPDLPALWAEAEALLAGNPQLLAYLRNCSALLATVLNGSASPLETLFPGGSFDLARDLYEHSATLRYINMLAAEGLAAFVDAAAGPLRILEVGAGSGATTASLLPLLGQAPSQDISYVFTDVSQLFLDQAASRFKTTPRLTFRLFDLDRDPGEQGFEDGGFDIVVAANAVHASADLPRALHRLRRLLAPGGALMLLESTTDFAWFDISTGLIEGWQHATDAARGERTLLTATEWLAALAEADFLAPRAWPSAGSPAAVLGQHLIIGRVPDAAAPVTVTARAFRQNEQAMRHATVPALGKGGEADALAARIAHAMPDERIDLLCAYVRHRVTRVLGRAEDDPPDLRDRLMDIGVDSLMAVQLRGLLGAGLGLQQALPATLMFDHPTIAALAEFLASYLAGPVRDSQTPACGAWDRRAAVEILDQQAVAALSEAEIEARVLALTREPIG